MSSVCVIDASSSSSSAPAVEVRADAARAAPAGKVAEERRGVLRVVDADAGEHVPRRLRRGEPDDAARRSLPSTRVPPRRARASCPSQLGPIRTSAVRVEVSAWNTAAA